MEYVNLGRTGVKVSRICLGTMSYGSSEGWAGLDEKASINIIHKALDLGINFVDTADIYHAGVTEEIVGNALLHKRENLFLTTKFKMRTGQGINDEGGSRFRIMKQVELSLKRLKTDYLDLYQIHRPDPQTPIDETLRALDDLVRQGKVRYVGCSNFDGWRIAEGLWVSDKMNLERFVLNQARYNLLDRHVEMEILPVSNKYNMTTLCYSPVDKGWLTERGFTKIIESPKDAAKLEKIKKLILISKRNNMTLGQLAIAWLLHQGKNVIPIIGVTKMTNLVENIDALTFELSKEDLEEIDTISPSPYVDFSK